MANQLRFNNASGYQGLRGDTTKIVTRDILKDVGQKSGYLVQSAIGMVKRAFYSFSRPPIDTFRMYLHTTVIFLSYNDSAVFSFRTLGIPYANFPYDGTSTSSSYGARPWLEVGAVNFEKTL